MRDPITLLINLLGYEKRKPSLLLMHMIEFTHSNWRQDLFSQNRISDYEYKLYS